MNKASINLSLLLSFGPHSISLADLTSADTQCAALVLDIK